jgi:hypothetical protein
MKVGFLCGLLAIAFSMPAQNSRSVTVVSAVGSFDAPLKKEVVDFGPSPYYPDPQTAPHVKLSCFYFPTFMVKEFDEGQKGAEWLAIVPTGKAEAALSCTRSHAPDEVVIEWWGYFKAAKTNLVFFHAPDGQDGGMPFAVFDSRTGKKIFADVAFDSDFLKTQVEVSPFNSLRVSGAQDGAISLKYLRVEAFECDLHLPTERSACWEKIRVQAGLRNRQIPVCTGYERIHSQYASAVAYPVEVFLLPRPIRRTIAGPVRCWPID